MKFTIRRILALASVACTASACVGSRALTSEVPAAGAEILWDNYGIPHIYAADRRSLAYALGWAQMRNHGDLLLRLIAQARGRGAELLGDEYLEEDRWTFTLGIPGSAGQALAAQSPAMRAHLAAFAAGVNGFAARHPELVADSVRVVLPVRAEDILAHQHRVVGVFLAYREDIHGETGRWSERGSNAWAVAPSRSASRNALLLANPHLPWGDFFTWTEAQLVIPGSTMYGAVLVGAPVLQIAFNDRLGWTHTVNTQDGTDLYELTLDGDGYRWNGSVRAFDREIHVIRVRLSVGYRDDTLIVRRSIHGPIVATKTGRAVALRVLGFELPFALEQWWNMGTARNFTEFQQAIAPNQISGQNITYADADGHIAVFYGGNTPRRASGDRAFWSGIVRGDTSATLWTARHEFGELPRTVDPPSGWAQNANDPPWWATFPPVVRIADYPSYVATRAMSLRAQRSAELLESDSTMTLEELISYKHSTRMKLAERLVGLLVTTVRASGPGPAREAAGVLERWDLTADADSRGGVLFVEWWRAYGEAMGQRSRWARPWSVEAPRMTPSGLADPAVAARALAIAARRTDSLHGALDVRWGEVYRLRHGGLDLPGNGAPHEHGVFRVAGYEREEDRYRMTGGDSYVAAIEFGQPVKAFTIVGPGNASRSGSPHRADQLGLFSSKRLKPAWLTRGEVERNLESREVVVLPTIPFGTDVTRLYE